eukprot:1007962-Prorocentrum_minimum.AAC.1
MPIPLTPLAPARRYEFVRDTLDSWFTAASPDCPQAASTLSPPPAPSAVSPIPHKKHPLALLPDTGVPMDTRGVYLPHLSHVRPPRCSAARCTSVWSSPAQSGLLESGPV